MTTKKQRTFHSPEFKAEALKLTEKTSVPSAAKELGMKESQLCTWHAAVSRKKSVSERESPLATENAKLKRKLAEQAEALEILKQAATCFAKNQK